MRYKCIVAYDGTNYYGFQIQGDLKTIELEIITAIKKAFSIDAKIYASGRTDKEVHAKGQVFHFDMDIEVLPNSVKKALNSFLPDDIYILSVEIVNEDFHARFSAKEKEYRYYINIGEYDPLKIHYMPHIDYLDIKLMEEAIHLFEGTHDFKGFASAQIDKRKDTVKTIFETKVNIIGDTVEFIFKGSAFLKYQVRRMMGLLIDIGRGYYQKEKILEVLEKKDPSISHRVAPGCGLYLYKVTY
ncbi:MAG: tRNA pseudouridine(38-40) synthase TruA [Acholeplasmatales bacterium]|nr:tRNA pseudouridine(38-40) synthase TruA [Acholeplasmatales bacterium]